MTKEEFESYVKTLVPENTVVIIQVPDDEIQVVSNSLNYLNNNFSNERGIVFITGSDRHKITVIPQGSQIKVNEETKEAI